MSDGSFVQFGHTKDPSGQQDGYIVRLDPGGEFFKALRFGGSGNETGISVAAAYGGGYVLTGATNSGGSGGLDIYVALFSGKDSLLWAYAYGGSGNEEPHEIIQTSDSGFLIGVTPGVTGIPVLTPIS